MPLRSIRLRTLHLYHLHQTERLLSPPIGDGGAHGALDRFLDRVGVAPPRFWQLLDRLQRRVVGDLVKARAVRIGVGNADEVDDILAARDRLKGEGARVLGDGEPKIGAHGKPVLFLHPKDFCGTLVELEQA